MSKELNMIYYGKDGDAAKEKAAAIRAERQTANIRHAEIFDGVAEDCAVVTIMPDVSGHDAGRIRAAYGDKVISVKPVAVVPPLRAPVPVAVVPPPVPPVKGA